MKYLLDTSPYIWLIDNDARLSATAKSIIEDSDNQIYLRSILLGNCYQTKSR